MKNVTEKDEIALIYGIVLSLTVIRMDVQHGLKSAGGNEKRRLYAALQKRLEFNPQ